VTIAGESAALFLEERRRLSRLRVTGNIRETELPDIEKK
jgi:hypothetical protein